MKDSNFINHYEKHVAKSFPEYFAEERDELFEPMTPEEYDEYAHILSQEPVYTSSVGLGGIRLVDENINEAIFDLILVRNGIFKTDCYIYNNYGTGELEGTNVISLSKIYTDTNDTEFKQKMTELMNFIVNILKPNK